ncbi:MAG: holo-ACP synthase [Anaerolineales bacterium]|nr:holo-ACP synthase [Anaerolineales bacterium]
MLVSSGIDIVEVERIDRAIIRHGQRFFQRFYTSTELVDAGGRTPALAARFAAKEAVAKALGTGIGEVGWKEIEIIKGPHKEPLLHLSGRADEIARELRITAWSISLSHTHEHAIAVAIALRQVS